MRTLALLITLSLFASVIALHLTGQQTYDALLASMEALEAHGTQDDIVKISLIMQSTNFAALHTQYGAPSAKRFLKFAKK